MIMNPEERHALIDINLEIVAKRWEVGLEIYPYWLDKIKYYASARCIQKETRDRLKVVAYRIETQQQQQKNQMNKSNR